MLVSIQKATVNRNQDQNPKQSIQSNLVRKV